jgi:hypothetical protein
MPIQLRCVDKDHQGEQWTLDLDGDKVLVRDAASKVVAELSPEDAAARFQMPSFSENVKYFGIAIGDRIQRFDVSKDGLREIRDFNNRLTVRGGPEAVQAVRNKAIRDTAIGVLCAVGGTVLTVGSYLSAANKPEGGNYTIAYGLVLFGLVVLGKGIYGFVQYGRIKALSES